MVGLDVGSCSGSCLLSLNGFQLAEYLGQIWLLRKLGAMCPEPDADLTLALSD